MGKQFYGGDGLVEKGVELCIFTKKTPHMVKFVLLLKIIKQKMNGTPKFNVSYILLMQLLMRRRIF